MIMMLIHKKKITCHLVDFAISANHRVKIKKSKKINKYLNLARELKKKKKKKKAVEHRPGK